MVSIDVGFGQVKVYTPERKEIIPAVVSLATKTQTQHLGFGKNGKAYEKLNVDGIDYYIGDKVLIESRGNDMQSRDSKRFVRDEYKVLIAGALIAIDLSDEQDIVLVLGLPLRDLSLSPELRKQFEGKTISVKTGETERKYKIAKVGVTGQGVSALYNTIPLSELANGTYGIIEIGSKTTDYSVLHEMEFSNTATDSKDVAMWNIIDDMKRVVEDYAKGQGLTDFTIDQRLIEKTIIDYIQNESEKFEIRIGAKQVVFTEKFKSTIHSVTGSMLDKVLPDLGSLYNLNALVIAGGATPLMFDYIHKQVGDKVVLKTPENPQFANAMGAYQMLADRMKNHRADGGENNG